MVTKVQIKSEKFTPFGGIFFVINLFKHRVMPHVDAFLGLRSSLVGYQYSEALLAMMCNFFSGGDHTEDINVLKSKLPQRPGFRICSPDTVLRCLSELSEKMVAGVPHFTLNLHGAWKLLQGKTHELKVYGHTSYIGKKLNYDDVEEEDFFVDPKMLFDLGVKYGYKHNFQISLDCENIFNTDHYICGPNYQHAPHFQRGRSLMASFSCQF